MKKVLLIVSVCTMFLSCTKDDISTVETIAPVEIVAPVETVASDPVTDCENRGELGCEGRFGGGTRSYADKNHLADY